MSTKYFRSLIALGAMILVVGCVQTKPVPSYARAGDIVIVGLGGVERNSNGAKVLNPSELDITITDSENSVFELDALQVFKSYPDPAAVVNAEAIKGNALGLVPFDGGWFAAVLLTEVGSGTPLPLATGPATVNVSSTKLENTAFLGEGDLSSLPLEILPGQSNVDGQYLQQFASYAPTKNRFLLAPDTPADFANIGGAFLSVEYYDDSYFNNGIEPIILPSSHNPYVQLSYNVVDNGNNTGVINIIILNPQGFVPANTGTNNSSSVNDLAVTLVYFALGSSALPAVAKTQFALDTSASYYIDTSGAIIEGLTPVLTHASDL
ncbi:hypothetical protein EYC98_18970 [Halieaceae bacterium IMCC14734]|uniref:DUF4382 domain-containing protein n=1 Tax=Candidatus Litorirhabdus singularis TaxID=2518993 RepID=A0ABT3TNJ5_9GAMM|nr:hypothetical protein [Candidatus Litorirhabdus singularis]MCX2982949.1 hypothetical protein [Candidatus Litorirhabdus singularis]